MKPVVREVAVPVGPDMAFRRFTTEIQRWWPRQTHSVSRDACREVVMEEGEGGRVFERNDEGEEVPWGVIVTWEPPTKLVFTWHPGRGEETAQEVEVRFRAVDEGCSVTVVHSGWEKFGERAEEVRGQYQEGWEPVLESYRDSLKG